MSEQQRRDFQRRVHLALRHAGGRIQFASRPAPTQRMLRNQYLSQMANAQSNGRPERLSHLFNEALAYLVAFALGSLAVFLARVLHYQLTGSASQFSTLLDLMIDAGLAISFAFLLREFLSLSAASRMKMQLLGILFALISMHNAVHYMPDLFSAIFPAEWVSHVLQTTEPGTLGVPGLEKPLLG